MTTFSIIILNYNTKNLTLRCLESIQKQYKKQLESGEFEIVVVDNNSTDGSVEAIQGLKLKVQSNSLKLKIIKNSKNEGFSKGNNIGAEAARGKYIFFLNSDTEINEKGLLKAINFLEENSKVGVLGLRMISKDESVQLSAGNFFSLINTALMLLAGERFGLVRFCPGKTQQVDWVSGGAMIVRKDLFEKINGFDENFFMYVEDMELCYRVKKTGYNIYYYLDTFVYHKELGSSNKAYAILSIYKGVIYFYKKHKSHFEYLAAKYLFKLKAFIAVLIGIATKNTYLINTYKKILLGNI